MVLLSAEGPLDLLLKLRSGGDAPRIASQAFIYGTRLRTIANGQSSLGLQSPLVLDCRILKSLDPKLPECPFPTLGTVGEGSITQGAAKAKRPLVLFNRPLNGSPLEVIAKDQYVVSEEARTYSVPCRGNAPQRVSFGVEYPSERDVFRLSYIGEGQYRYLRSNGQSATSNSSNWGLEDHQFELVFPGACSLRYEVWRKIKLENGRKGWVLSDANEIGVRNGTSNLIGLSMHDDFEWGDVPAWAQ
jgi:hypothetical protein